jgi:transposase-like protein
LEQRGRSERALVAVVAECYVRGVSTRRVEGLVRTLGIERLSKSQVSAMAQELDPLVASFRNRPLDPAGYPYLWLDALTQRVREDGRIVNVCAVVATGVTADGKREILGVDVASAEDGAAWTAFLRGLVARGLKGVRLVISDAHEGLKNAIAAVLDGASWQRCRTHRLRNVDAKLPPRPALQNEIRAAYWAALDDATSAADAETRLRQLVDRLAREYPSAAACLADDLPALCVHLRYPLHLRKRLRSSNLLERSLGEVRRRTKVIGRFPGETSCLSLCWAVLDLVIAGARGLGMTDLDHQEIARLRSARAPMDAHALIA